MTFFSRVASVHVKLFSEDGAVLGYADFRNGQWTAPSSEAADAMLRDERALGLHGIVPEHATHDQVHPRAEDAHGERECTDEDRADAADRVLRGEPAEDVAHDYGVSVSTVKRWIKRFGSQ